MSLMCAMKASRHDYIYHIYKFNNAYFVVLFFFVCSYFGGKTLTLFIRIVCQFEAQHCLCVAVSVSVSVCMSHIGEL